jgi:hypothetical protein
MLRSFVLGCWSVGREGRGCVMGCDCVMKKGCADS